MSLLGVGAGAADGLDSFLAQELMRQKFDQSKVEHTDDVALKTRQLDQTGDNLKSEAQLRAEQTQEILRKRAEEDRQATARKGIIANPATPQIGQFAQLEDAGIKTPADLITEPTGPPHAPPALGPVEKDEKGFFRRINPDNTVSAPLADTTGPVRSQQPPAPALQQVSGAAVPSLVDPRNPNAPAIPIKGVDVKQSAAVQAQSANKKTGIEAVDRLNGDIDKASAMGLLGPASGRYYNALAKVGTTKGLPGGGPEVDSLIGRIKGDILLTKMHTDAGIGGTRAAASPMLLQQWEDLAMKSSPEIIKGYLSGIREDMSSGSAPAAAGTDSKDPLGLFTK